MREKQMGTEKGGEAAGERESVRPVGKRDWGQEMLRADRGTGQAQGGERRQGRVGCVGQEGGVGGGGLGAEADPGAPASSLFCPGIWAVG